MCISTPGKSKIGERCKLRKSDSIENLLPNCVLFVITNQIFSLIHIVAIYIFDQKNDNHIPCNPKIKIFKWQWKFFKYYFTILYHFYDKCDTLGKSAELSQICQFKLNNISKSPIFWE